MKIAKIISLSTVDFPGIPSMVLFLSGCNLNCKFCHNHPLINYSEGKETSIEEIHNLISKNILADGISITGGEPLIQTSEISKLLEILGDKQVSIDTNGLFPEQLRSLLKKTQVKRIAMDLKCSFQNYSSLTQTSHGEVYFKKNIEQSIYNVEQSKRIF